MSARMSPTASVPARSTGFVPFLDLGTTTAVVAQEVRVGWEKVIDSNHFVGGEEVEVFEREMDRLRRMPSGSPEAAQVRAYLQWIWSLPWESQVSEEADLLAVEKMLAAEHLGLEKAKDRVVEYLAVRRLKPDLPGPALCLVGPPGTGK